MENLNQSNSEEFLSRFYRCFDGVIRYVNIVYQSPRYPSKATVMLSVRDSHSVGNEGWVNLWVELEQLQEWSIKENDKESYQVMSDGLALFFLGDVVYLDFGHARDAPTTVNQLRDSALYFAAKYVSWESREYDAGPPAT